MIYLSVDVEASGPFPGMYSLLSIGALPVIRGEHGWYLGKDSTFYIELKPLEGAGELEAAMKIHGLTREHLLEHGEEPLEAMKAFGDYLRRLKRKHKKVVPAAWPSSFDAPYIGWYNQKFLGSNPLGWSAFDIPSYALGLFKCTRPELRDKMKAAGLVKPTNPQQHHALNDAIEQGETLVQLLNYATFGTGAGAG